MTHEQGGGGGAGLGGGLGGGGLGGAAAYTWQRVRPRSSGSEVAKLRVRQGDHALSLC